MIISGCPRGIMNKRVRVYRTGDLAADMENFRRLVWLSGLKGWRESYYTFAVRYDKDSKRDTKMIERLDTLAIFVDEDSGLP